MPKLLLLLAAVVIATTLPASAEVKDSGASGFTVSSTFTVPSAPAEVWRRILLVGNWWGNEHTYSGDAHNLTIEAKLMGCFCEKLPKGGVAHMQVATLMPGQLLVMTGALGPLQQMGAAGSMTFKLTAAGGGTRVEFTYAAAGFQATGMAALAPIVDGVLMEQIGRLKNYIEKGNPAPKR